MPFSEVGEGDRVHRIELVLVVEVGVEAVHDEHDFLPTLVGRRAEQPAFRYGAFERMALGVGVDDERAVEALVDVPLQRQRMAVVEVAAEGLCIELVGEGAARLDQPGARNAVHARRDGCRGNGSCADGSSRWRNGCGGARPRCSGGSDPARDHYRSRPERRRPARFDLGVGRALSSTRAPALPFSS